MSRTTVDAHVLQMLRRAQAGQQQQLRRAVGAAGHDDLAACARGAAACRRVVFDADRAVVLDQHARGVGAGAHHQVGRVRAGCRYAFAVLQRRLLLVVVW